MNRSRVYTSTTMEGFERIAPVRSADFNIFIEFDGTPRATTWKPVEMELLRHLGGKSLRPADMPWIGAEALMLTERAAEVVGDLLLKWGELLPLICGQQSMYVFNPLHVIDALDEDASRIARSPRGRIIKIEQYAFRPEVLDAVPIFKLPQFPRGCPIYTTRELVDVIASAGLTGTSFTELWRESTDDDAEPLARSGGSPVPVPHDDTARDRSDPTAVFLDGVWQSVIPRTDDVSWVTRVAALPFEDEPLGDYGPLVRRMLDAGLSPEEIARFAQLVGYETAFGMCDYVEDSEMAYAYEPDDAPQFHWGVFLVDPKTDRPVIPLGGLHSGILSADPSGREMRP